MNRLHVLPMLALPLAVSACGGGGGGGVASTPPPPSASYQTLDQLTGNQSFQSGGIHWTASPSGPTGQSVDAFGAGMTFAYDAASDTFTIATPTGINATFDASTFVASQSTATRRVFSKGSGTTTQMLSLTRPTVGGVALSYVEVANFLNAGTGTSWLAVGGIPTRATDMPRTGTATYTAETGATVLVNGAQYAANAAAGSTATFSANFGANSVATSVHLAGAPIGGGTVVDFGTVNGTGTISSTGPGFTGSFTGTTGAGFSGAFFGPQGAEAAYVYNFKSTFGGGTYEAFGATSGRKN